ncbi:hypothetical protein ACFO3O_21440 [Dokdonia ponticola]|uniref:Uncharacterized protein n=1 Tax=Dokdonia ponticola TaxID=2041041 RepID=A0ABV9I4W1_9FLAO
MAISGYQSDVAQNSGTQTSRNTVTLQQILPEHLSPSLTHLPSQNTYSLINENLIVAKDIRLLPNSPELEIGDWLVSLPAPLVDQGVYTGTLFSVQGSQFFYSIDIDGRVTISGTFVNEQDELILNINPYIAELPLRFKTFGSPF